MSRANLAPGAWEHRGWLIDCIFPPVPDRRFDWSASHPDFDGTVVVYAETHAGLIEEIDAHIEEQGA